MSKRPGFWLHELASLLDAGLPVNKALLSIVESLPKSEKPMVEKAARLINAGRSLASALSDCSMVDDYTLRVLEVGERSGRLAAVLKQLAIRADRNARHLTKLKADLTQPLIVLVLAIFIAPIPDLFRGTFNSWQYVIQTFGSIALFFALVFVARFLKPNLKPKGSAIPLFDKLELAIPVWRGLKIRNCCNSFLESLELAYSTGVPLHDAVKISVTTINNKVVAKAFKPVPRWLSAGLSIAESLSSVTYLSADTLAAIRNAEFAGELGETLSRIVRQQHEYINLDTEELTAWLPRIIYTLIGIWIAIQILGGWRTLLNLGI